MKRPEREEEEDEDEEEEEEGEEDKGRRKGRRKRRRVGNCCCSFSQGRKICQYRVAETIHGELGCTWVGCT